MFVRGDAEANQVCNISCSIVLNQQYPHFTFQQSQSYLGRHSSSHGLWAHLAKVIRAYHIAFECRTQFDCSSLQKHHSSGGSSEVSSARDMAAGQFSGGNALANLQKRCISSDCLSAGEERS